MTKYYPNNDQECGRSALANLLLELNDPIAAQVVYDNFRKQEFVNNQGTIYGALLPRMLRNLTSGAYSGVIFCHMEPNLEQDLMKLYGNQWQRARKAVREEQSLGTIQEAPKQFEHSLPAVIVIKPKFYRGRMEELIPYNCKQNHAVVIKNQQTIIDNGFEVNCQVSNLEVVAVFEAKKNQ